MRTPAIVYDRTSGDERQGQDAKAQLAQSVHLAAQRFVVVGAFSDEDVPGEAPWGSRPGLRKALANLVPGVVLVTREPSRLWRGLPETGLALLGQIRDLTVLTSPCWERRDGAYTDAARSAHLLRFFDLWRAWDEKATAQERTQLALDEIKAGRRATATGRGLGRPRTVLDARHLERAREIQRDGGSLGMAHRAVLTLRGYFDAQDPKTRKKRFVGRETLARALGLRAAQKSPLPKTPGGPRRQASVQDRPITSEENQQ